MTGDGNHPGSPAVLVSDRQSLPVDRAALVLLAAQVLEGEGRAAGELSISFVTDDEIADLHVRFMKEAGPTDVLSFPMDEEAGVDGVRVLGDVVIAPGYAGRGGRDRDAEIRLLLVHGILHLLGYDHEDEDDRAHMWVRQERYSGVRVP